MLLVCLFWTASAVLVRVDIDSIARETDEELNLEKEHEQARRLEDGLGSGSIDSAIGVKVQGQEQAAEINSLIESETTATHSGIETVKLAIIQPGACPLSAEECKADTLVAKTCRKYCRIQGGEVRMASMYEKNPTVDGGDLEIGPSPDYLLGSAHSLKFKGLVGMGVKEITCRTKSASGKFTTIWNYGSTSTTTPNGRIYLPTTSTRLFQDRPHDYFDLQDYLVKVYPCEDTSPLFIELVVPAWAEKGWSSTSPGFVVRFNGPRDVKYGSNDILADLDPVYAVHSSIQGLGRVYLTKVTEFSHRYVDKETFKALKDIFKAHSLLLFEWSDKTVSVGELGWRNGVGGFGGETIFYEEPAKMPDAMNLPYFAHLAELRLFEKPFGMKTGDATSFMKQLTSTTDGFLDPEVSQLSKEVKPDLRDKITRSALVELMVNWNSSPHDTYSLRRQCQTFSTDLYNYLTDSDATPLTMNLFRFRLRDTKKDFEVDLNKIEKDKLKKMN